MQASHPLTVDLYELTMADSYLRRGRNERAVFDLFVRPPVPARRFLIAAGIERALDYLLTLRFSEEDRNYLRSLGVFSDEFLAYLADFRFSGDVWAVREGELVFPGAPLLYVDAPRIEAQIVETYLLNVVNFHTLIASKAARVRLAAGFEASVVDFSPRRDHGPGAALGVAYASYLAGLDGTSNVEAGRRLGIPVVGTMAHAYVMSFASELEAFRAFAADHPAPVLLIDTYDTLEGARRALVVARELREQGRALVGVRIDSGDLPTLTRKVRRIFDEAGFPEIKILISGDLDEYRIQAFLAAGGVADGYGVGTRLGTSYDLPALGGVYKLVEDEAGPHLKKSPGKQTWPGRKQVWRREEEGWIRDVLGLADEAQPGEPLLRPRLRAGRRVAEAEPLESVRERVRTRFASLPEDLRVIAEDPKPTYPLEASPGLLALARRLERARN
ncbi:MAG TPA: nicotinate phosphoribosyltransferase [Oceanithermus profundus]|uniref:Nicotinate phosphoribosyltransferase n=1 Tax=Oceanithermus profundus TaxID=187137 RepID=A0A7C4VD40_9DEIN|nr:nicotinate phosphoribosyltransferase [Oceanithermus profundus]